MSGHEYPQTSHMIVLYNIFYSPPNPYFFLLTLFLISLDLLGVMTQWIFEYPWSLCCHCFTCSDGTGTWVIRAGEAKRLEVHGGSFLEWSHNTSKRIRWHLLSVKIPPWSGDDLSIPLSFNLFRKWSLITGTGPSRFKFQLSYRYVGLHE